MTPFLDWPCRSPALPPLVSRPPRLSRGVRSTDDSGEQPAPRRQHDDFDGRRDQQLVAPTDPIRSRARPHSVCSRCDDLLTSCQIHRIRTARLFPLFAGVRWRLRRPRPARRQCTGGKLLTLCLTRRDQTVTRLSSLAAIRQWRHSPPSARIVFGERTEFAEFTAPKFCRHRMRHLATTRDNTGCQHQQTS